MHDFVMNQVGQWVRKYELNKVESVLEVGAQDFNGSVRPFFDGVGEYIGTDMQPGKGVDMVVASQELYMKFNPKVFDVVVCLEMLEHDIEFWVTLANINMVLKPGGKLILTARGATKGKDGRNGESMWEHGYPHDYWRFMPQAVPELMSMAGCSVDEQLQDQQHPGFLAIGTKLERNHPRL